MSCSFCNNKNRKDWIEDGFWGITCTPCGSAFITPIEHKRILSKEEFSKIYDLIKKHYPGFQVLGFGVHNDGRHVHFFEAVKKDG